MNPAISMQQIFLGRETEAGKNVLFENLDQQTLDFIKQTYEEEKGSMIWVICQMRSNQERVSYLIYHYRM